MKFKTKLQTMKKEGSSLREYFANFKQCIDALALASFGKIVPLDDHINYAYFRWT